MTDLSINIRYTYKTSVDNRSYMAQGVKLSTSTLETNCKITVNERMPIGDNFFVSYSFGTGMKKFCMTASYRKPREIYIDRVERNGLCIKGGLVDDNSTSDVVLLGLYFIKTRMPIVTHFTLQDDSYAYCMKGVTSGKKLSMTYEAIMKYNQTWYQQKCHARLPGFVSVREMTFGSSSPQHRVIPCIAGTKLGETIEYRTIYYEAIQGSIMEKYLDSLVVLDQPSIPYENAIDPFPTLERYREDYLATSTPREFISHIRNRLKTTEAYCMEVDGWFEGYMKFLDIKAFKEEWFIPIEVITKPDGYIETPMSQKDVINTFTGGGRKRSYTRKHGNRRTVWRMGPCEGGRFGYAVGDIHDM